MWHLFVADAPDLDVFQFVYEGMEESGSEGLDELLNARKDTFLKVENSFQRQLQNQQ